MQFFSTNALLVLFFFYLCPSIHSLPAIIPDSFRLTNISHSLHGKTEPPPLIYHIPNTHNTLYIQPAPVRLPPRGIAASLWSARNFVAHEIAIRQGNADIPLPSDQDPGQYQARGSVVKIDMHTPPSNEVPVGLAPQAASEHSSSQSLSPPPPPSPSADTKNLQQVTTPAREIQDPGFVVRHQDIDIFTLPPTTALKMLCSLANALIRYAELNPFTPSIGTSIPPKPSLIVSGKENQPSQSRSSNMDKRRSQPPSSRELTDPESVPEKARTPIGSPETKPEKPSGIADTISLSPSSSAASQNSAVARKFNSRNPPPISIYEYLCRLYKYCAMSTGAFLATCLYLYRAAIVQESLALTTHNIHRLLLAGLRVAGKANDDLNYPHKRWATVGGVTESELAKLEIAFCYITDFELRVTAETLTHHVKESRWIDKRTMVLTKTLFLTILLPLASADIQFTSPAAGAVLQAAKPITAKWKDSGDGTALTDLATYTLFLCAGGNDAATILQLAPINANGQFSTGNEASATVAAAVGGPDKNAYFLKIQSVGKDGSQVINYSDRFTLSGMTGTFPPTIQAGIAKITDTTGPASTNQEAPAAAGGAQGAQGDYAVTYTAQTGLIKYAPMQIPPGTKITAKTVSPRYPTSSVPIAKAFLPTPKQTTTMTASLTVKPAVSHAFNAPAASMPAADDMQKFLNRWRD
ncbi:MAG: hypothetical protein Q9203_006751 [Teloschistes exilis]